MPGGSPPALTIYPSAAYQIVIGGQPVVAIYGGALGGIIQNPASALDQGIAVAESLYVNVAGAAGDVAGPTTSVLAPGDSTLIPPGTLISVSVSAVTSGHRFSCVVLQPATQYPPTMQTGAFPPAAPTSMVAVIPSYVYQEYSDDDDVQAFFAAYNGEAQAYISGFNSLNLPIYTDDVISGALLDWVGNGVYGVARPSLSSGVSRTIGLLNTYAFNTLVMNASKKIVTSGVTDSSDDVYKRVITWGYFKGDGKLINVRWLKRRIARFLYGINGTNYPVSSTYQISITFGVGNAVSITLAGPQSKLIGGALMNTFKFNTTLMNYYKIQVTPISPLPNAQLWAEAVASGTCEMPFQFNYTVVT